MCGWPSTSDPAGLLTSLRRQPVLAVLRPPTIEQARGQLDQLLASGLHHVELAVRADAQWVAMARALQAEFPDLRLGAASVCHGTALAAVVEAGLAYAVSPILDRALLTNAAASGLTLVPGVFSPSEVAAAVAWGAPAVKLFPASALGPGYWPSLAGPLGPLPFCIAAGGLRVDDVPAWMAAGVDAVALGNTLFDASPLPRLQPDLQPLLARLTDRADAGLLST